MADVFSKRKRSAVMAAIRSRGNKATELRLVAVFRAQGITGWRRQRQLRMKVEGLKSKVTGRRAGSGQDARAYREAKSLENADLVMG